MFAHYQEAGRSPGTTRSQSRRWRAGDRTFRSGPLRTPDSVPCSGSVPRSGPSRQRDTDPGGQESEGPPAGRALRPFTQGTSLGRVDLTRRRCGEAVGVAGAGSRPRRRSGGLPDRPHSRNPPTGEGTWQRRGERGGCTRTTGPAGASPRRRGRDPEAVPCGGRRESRRSGIRGGARNSGVVHGEDLQEEADPHARGTVSRRAAPPQEHKATAVGAR